MASVNKAILVGNLGKDPDVRYSPDGSAITNITLATTENWKDKSGEKQEKTEWHRVAFFGKLAEIAGEYLKKGSQVYIEGRIQTRKWQDKDGQDRYTTEIVADRMHMLGGRGEAQERPAPQHQERQQPQRPAQQSKGGFDDMDDDIPFSDEGGRTSVKTRNNNERKAEWNRQKCSPRNRKKSGSSTSTRSWTWSASAAPRFTRKSRKAYSPHP